VKKPDKFARLSGDGVLNDPLFKENMLTFPVAYGLALQGLGEARLNTNLLPKEIVRDRQIRAKKPFVGAAGAWRLWGRGARAWGYAVPSAAAADKKPAGARLAAKSAVAEADAQNTKVDSKKTEVKTTQEQAKMVLAGQDERLNWPRFQEVFSA